MIDNAVPPAPNRLVAAAGLVGAIGAGLAFATTGPSAAGQARLSSEYWLGGGISRWQTIPLLYLACVLLTATIAGRWGWWVFVGGQAVTLAFAKTYESLVLGDFANIVVSTVVGGVAVGGAVAAFGAAERLGRVAMAAGFGIGLIGAWIFLGGLWAVLRDTVNMLDTWRYIVAGVPAVLGLVAATAWLVYGAGREPRGRSRTWTPAVAALAVATAVVGLQLGLLAVLRGLTMSSTGGTSDRRLDAVEALHRAGLLTLAVVAGLGLAVVAYRLGGSGPARWVLVGAAAGVIRVSIPLWAIRGEHVFWTLGSAAVVGAVAGVLLARSRAGVVPWDAVGLIAVAIGVILTSPRGQLELDESVSLVIQHAAVALLALAVTAALTTALTMAAADPGRVGPDGTAAVVSAGLGVAAFALAVMVAFPALSQDQFGSMSIGPAITVGALALGILALYALGQLRRSVRRSLEAELLVAPTATPPEPAPGS